MVEAEAAAQHMIISPQFREPLDQGDLAEAAQEVRPNSTGVLPQMEVLADSAAVAVAVGESPGKRSLKIGARMEE